MADTQHAHGLPPCLRLTDELDLVGGSLLFTATQRHEVVAMLGCLEARRRDCSRGERVLRAGQCVDAVGLVLAGGVDLVREDYWGNRNIVATVSPGEVFAESYAAVPGAVFDMNAVARADTSVLFLDIRRIMTQCGSACLFHAQLIANLVAVVASKNLGMHDKLVHMSQRTTRERLRSYLGSEAARAGSATFEIPFNRGELADYLSVNRSAMSVELAKMRDAGEVDFDRGRRFTLHSRSTHEDVGQ